MKEYSDSSNLTAQFLEELMAGSDKNPAFIRDYKEYHTDTSGMSHLWMTAMRVVEG